MKSIVSLEGVVRLLCHIRATKQPRCLHFVMQCNRVPIISIRPSERPILDEDSRKIGLVLERLCRWAGLLADGRKIADADRSVGKFNFQFVGTEYAKSDYVYHRSGPPRI